MSYIYNGWTISKREYGFGSHCSKLFCPKWGMWRWQKTSDDKTLTYYYCDPHMDKFAVKDINKEYLGITGVVKTIRQIKIDMYKDQAELLLNQLKLEPQCICKENYLIEWYEKERKLPTEHDVQNELLYAFRQKKNCDGLVCMVKELTK